MTDGRRGRSNGKGGRKTKYHVRKILRISWRKKKLVSGAERNGPAGEEENKPCPGSKKQTEEMDGKHRENQERYVYLSGIDSRLQKTFQIHYFEAAAVSPSQEEVCKPHGNLRKEEHRKGKSAQRTFLFSVCSVCFLSRVFQYP